MSPPIILASCEQMLKPRPVPPYCLLRPESPCTNGSKIFSCMCFGIPRPVSSTSNSNMYGRLDTGAGDVDRSLTRIRLTGFGSRGLMASAVPPVTEMADCCELELARRLPWFCLDVLLDSDFLLLSSSSSCSISPMHRIRSCTVPPAGVNFKLLLTRFIITCRIRCWSPRR